MRVCVCMYIYHSLPLIHSYIISFYQTRLFVIPLDGTQYQH